MFGRKKFDDLNVRAYYSDFVKGERPHQLIDVRTPGEFASGHIPGSVNIPLNTIDSRMGELNTALPVVVVCASGNRSQTGANKIAKAGFEDVYNIQGGVMDWLCQGFKTVK